MPSRAVRVLAEIARANDGHPAFLIAFRSSKTPTAQVIRATGKAASSMIGRQTAHQQIGITSFIHRLTVPAIKAARFVSALNTPFLRRLVGKMAIR
jgi:hypothetical protein